MKMKKSIAALCAATMALSMVGTTAFAVDYAISNGAGNSDSSSSTVAKDNTVTRGEVIKAIQYGKAIEIESGSTVVSKSLVSEIAAAETPVTFVADEYSITIDPDSVTSVKAIDLGISIATNDKAITIAPAMKGEFGLEMQITLPKSALGKVNASVAHVYYVSDDGKVEDLGPVTVNADGSVSITISHASQYVITESVEDVSAAAAATADGEACTL